MTAETSQRARLIRQVQQCDTLEGLVNGLQGADATAALVFHRRFGDLVNRLVWRLLGADPEHDDVVQQVFIQILSSINKLKEPQRLESWVIGVTINTVRKEIRSRRYRRWLHPATTTEEPLAEGVSPDRRLAARRFYQVLEGMRAEHRTLLGLRFVEGYTVNEIALYCGYALATAKRKLRRAQDAFVKRARRDPILASWVEEP
jgi:RNA polymerase sigma-70 factor (ECF subfamily)